MTIAGVASAKERSTGAASRFPASPDEQLFSGGPLDAAAIFGRRAPLELEIGSGKARFLIDAARRHPAHDFVGVEMSLAYYRICRERVARAGLPNIRVLRAEGRRFLETAFSPASLAAIHVYFPDPWPRKRQRKRRLLDGMFLDLAASRLVPGGILRIATDHEDYGTRIAPLLASVPELEPRGWDEIPPPPPTHYEIKYAQEGRRIWRFLLTKRASRPPAGG
jgi:tRNA (guanine-N7-)-methyltransferase